jgi:hypothetical protein
VTVYTDEYCSDSATAARLDTCTSSSSGWKSYSVDNCGE